MSLSSRSLKWLLSCICILLLNHEFVVVTAAADVQQTLLLTVVIVELIFAFGVGITCVIFSINLYRALLSEGHDDASNHRDDLPTNYVTRDTFGHPPGRRSAPGIQHALQQEPSYNAVHGEDVEDDIDDCASDDYELERSARRNHNHNRSFRAAVASFTAYLRFW